jgi:hypothetical protein
MGTQAEVKAGMPAVDTWVLWREGLRGHVRFTHSIHSWCNTYESAAWPRHSEYVNCIVLKTGIWYDGSLPVVEMPLTVYSFAAFTAPAVAWCTAARSTTAASRRNWDAMETWSKKARGGGYAQEAMRRKAAGGR